MKNLKQDIYTLLEGFLPQEQYISHEEAQNLSERIISLIQPIRKCKSYPKEAYIEIIDKYQELKGIQLKGQEFSPIQQSIKTMFMSGRTSENIIACMEFMAEDKYYKDKWNINIIRLKLPEFLSKGNEKPNIPEYAK